MTYEEMADKHAEEYVKHWIVGEDDIQWIENEKGEVVYGKSKM